MADEYQLEQSKGLAIGAAVCGIIGVLLLPVGFIGLVLGIIALTKGQHRGLAIAGIVLGVLELLAMLVLAWWLSLFVGGLGGGMPH